MTAKDAIDTLTDGRNRALMSIEDVAQELNCSPRHVRRMADDGRMPPPIKLGTLVRWPRAMIERWIADGCPDCRDLKGGDRR